MVALNLLAASLLVAGVGSSLGLPSPRNVSVLPAVSSCVVSYHHTEDEELNPPIDEFVLISPLSDGSSADFSISEGTGLDVNMYFGDTELAAVSNEDYAFHVTYADGVVTYEDVLLSNLDSSLMIYVSFGIEYGNHYEFAYVDVNLPDLVYWDDDEIYVYVSAIDDINAPRFSYLGLFSDSHDPLVGISPAELGADVNPITAITDGLTAIVPLGGALTDGFDAVFMDDGALTAVGMFGFILMGIGISVSITKKCFNWVTGRHGM